MKKDNIDKETGEGIAEQAPAPSLRKYRERIKARYPDVNPEKEEDWYDLEDRYAEEVEADLGKYKSVDEALTEAMKAEPEFAEIAYDIAVNKVPFRIAIARHLSQEDLIPGEGDPDYEEFQKVRSERLSQSKAMEERNKQIEANEAKTLEAIDAFAQENGYSEEQKGSLISLINDTFDKLIMKEISPELLLSFHKMMNFDQEVLAAEEAGKIEGRNESIDLKKKTDKDKKEGDGVPVPAGVKSKDVVAKRTNQFFEGIGNRPKI